MIFIIAAIFLFTTITIFIVAPVRNSKQDTINRLTMWNILTFSYTFVLICIVLTLLEVMNKNAYIYLYMALAVVLISAVLAIIFKNVRFINLWVISACLMVHPLVGLIKDDIMTLFLPLLAITGISLASILAFYGGYVGLIIISTAASIILAKKYNKKFLYLLILPAVLLLCAEKWIAAYFILLVLILTHLITIVILNAKLLDYVEQGTELSGKKYQKYKKVFVVIHYIFAFAFAVSIVVPCLVCMWSDTDIGFGILIVLFVIIPYFVTSLLPTYLLASFYNRVFKEIAAENDPLQENNP